MNALNLNNIIFCIGEENGIISDFWKDVTVVSLTNDFSNSVGALLGGMSQAFPTGNPNISFSIEKPFTFNEKLLDYFMGTHNVALVEASIDTLKSGDVITASGANFDVVMTEYSISLTAGEVPSLSASFVGQKVYQPQTWEVTFKKNWLKKEISKMDRIAPYLDIFDDEAIYMMNFSERKNVTIKWPMNWTSKTILLESPLINQQLSASGYTSSLRNFPFNEQLNLLEKYLLQKNEVLGIKILSEDLFEKNEYYLSYPRLNNLNISASDSDYFQFGIDFIGTRTILE